MRTLTIHSIDQAMRVITSKLTKLGNPKIAYIGQRAADVYMFTPFVHIDLVICLDMEEVGIPTISLEKKTGKKDLWYSTMLSRLLQEPEIVMEILQTLPKGSLVIPYASTPELEAFCIRNGYFLLGERYDLRCKFENKARLVLLKQELGIPNTSSLISKNDVNYPHLSETYGTKFVIQNPKGSSGTGTFIIEREENLNQIYSALADQVIVTSFHDGLTISANFVLTDQQILTIHPSIQVIGQPELSISKSTFCGVDFPLYEQVVTESEKQEIHEIVYTVATAMHKSGYRGPANVNIMRESLELTDINARFMGSGLLTTKYQLQEGLVPISLVHLMQFIDIDFLLSATLVENYQRSLNASMIVLHNLIESEQVVINAPILRIFVEGSVLDLTGRLIPKYQSIHKENNNERVCNNRT